MAEMSNTATASGTHALVLEGVGRSFGALVALEGISFAFEAGERLAILGANGAGKTNLLEAIYYPVLFRSFRGAADAEVARFGSEGFHVGVTFGDGNSPGTAETTWTAAGREKKLAIDGAPVGTLASAAGRWLAVAFLPSDTGLAGGAPAERRQYLDRMLALASPDYLRALARYRQGIARRNAALRKGEWAAAHRT